MLFPKLITLLLVAPIATFVASLVCLRGSNRAWISDCKLFHNDHGLLNRFRTNDLMGDALCLTGILWFYAAIVLLVLAMFDTKNGVVNLDLLITQATVLAVIIGVASIVLAVFDIIRSMFNPV